MNTNNTCNNTKTTTASCPNNVNRGSNAFVIIIVLYILLAIIIGSWHY